MGFFSETKTKQYKQQRVIVMGPFKTTQGSQDSVGGGGLGGCLERKSPREPWCLLPSLLVWLPQGDREIGGGGGRVGGLGTP